METRAAYSGREALATAAEFNPDAVLLDIEMPEMRGYEVARRIRDADWGKSVLLIAVSGWAQESDKRLSEEAGFDHHVQKPVDFDALKRLLEAARRD
jgi:CheY-like chemotaxis protein